MRWKLFLIAALVAIAVSGNSLAAAQRVSTKQRVVISGQKDDINSFVLTPRTAGPVARDRGGNSWCCWTQRVHVVNGQKVEVNDPTLTLTGNHGTLVLKVLISWVDAGTDYSVGTGARRVGRGTGALAKVRGGGRGALLWIGQVPTSWRLEGYLTRP